jgi:hypothetical protein
MPKISDAVKEMVMAVGELTQWNKKHTGVKGKEVARRIGVKKWTVSRYIARAIKAGFLINKGTGKGAPQKLVLGPSFPGAENFDVQLQPKRKLLATQQRSDATPVEQEGCNPDATTRIHGKNQERLHGCNHGVAIRVELPPGYCFFDFCEAALFKDNAALFCNEAGQEVLEMSECPLGLWFKGQKGT